MKLDCYGIRGTSLGWFRSCLTNRKQFVRINGSNSHTLNITSRVPHGSELGPLLFLIYIHDLPNSFSKLLFYSFADDTHIYYKAEGSQMLQKIVSKELKKAKAWLDDNKVPSNIEKTNFIVLKTPRHSSEAATKKVGKQHLRQTKYVRFLGILSDEHLYWKRHWLELFKKLARTYGMVFKNTSFFANQCPDLLIQLPFLLSFLQYGTTDWGPTYESYIKPVYLLQKKILRAIAFEHFIPPSAPIVLNLKILRLSDRFQLKQLCSMYECINRASPTNFYSFIVPVASVDQYSTRKSSNNDIFSSKKNTSLYGL